MEPLKLILILLCTGSLLLLPHAALAASAMRLDQTHSFMGRAQLTVSAKGIRLENTDKLKFILVAKAPDWRVTVFRNDDKTYYSESLKEFENTGLFSGFIMLLPAMNLERNSYNKATTKFLGRDAVVLTNARTTLKYIPKGDVAPEAERIVYNAYKSPTQGGLPVYYVKAHTGKNYTTGENQEGQLETIIKTSKIETIADNPKFYTAPSGYKLAKSLGVVFAGTVVRADSIDFQSLFEMKTPGDTKARKKQ